MILGIGIDLVEVDRIHHSIERFGERFLRRIMHPAEITYCLAHRNAHPHVAARFAAKEAISKAFGTGIGAKLGWLDMEVAHRDGGQPYVILHDKGLLLLQEKKGMELHLSLSHTAHHATAIALIEG